VVGVNDLTDNKTLAHLLKYDSILGRLDGDVSFSGDEISVDGKSFKALAERDPSALPWKELGPTSCIESTGIFTDATKAQGAHRRWGQEGRHLGAGQERGRHDRDGRQRRRVRRRRAPHHLERLLHHELPGPLAKVLNDTFGIERA
jgi:glyceraldehyde 3-phosphate dehydrogenase